MRERMENGPLPLAYATTQSQLAAALGRLGKCKESEELCRQVLEKREELLGAQHFETLVAAHHLGVGTVW